MGDYDEADPATDGRRRPWLTGAVVLLALLVGVVAGFLLGGGTSTSSSVAEVRTTPETEVPATSAAPPDPATPQPCLQAGSAASQVLVELEAAVVAIGALDPTALRGVLDRLQPVQGELEASVAACGDRVSTPPPPGPTG